MSGGQRSSSDKLPDFLGTEGDVWDTQWDMFMAFVGAITAQLTLSPLHDRELDSLEMMEMPAPLRKIKHL